MAGTGPAPNEASRRQAKLAGTWLDLPANGYDGDIPDFPLVSNALASGHDNDRDDELEDLDRDAMDQLAGAMQLDEREAQVWQTIWRTPQAAAWHLNGWVHDVGLYVRALVRGEFGDLDHAKEARMWSDRLGLNPTSMLKNRWRVRPDEVEQKRQDKGKPKPKKKRKLVAVDDAVAGS